MVSLDDVQERRDEREMYSETSRDPSSFEDYFARGALSYRLRLIASEYFSGENFHRLMQKHPYVGCFLVLGRGEVIGYGEDLPEACQMAQQKGFRAEDCLSLFMQPSIF